MKLIRCYIENFGKLSNFDMSFNEGINCINKKNGFGKTTLANFIKAMFYGLEYKRKKDLYDRTRYLPWNNLNCGGYLIFEIDNNIYRIQRTFGKTNKDDTFMLFNEYTNLISYDYSENIGQEIFGIDKKSFENTIFIDLKNNNNLLTEMISNKLNDNKDIQCVDEYQRAYNLLDKKATSIYSKRGNKGLIYKKQEELAYYKRQLVDCNINKKEINKINEKIKAIDSNILTLHNDIYNSNVKSQPMHNSDLKHIDVLLDNYNKSCNLDEQIKSLDNKLYFYKNKYYQKYNKPKIKNILFIVNIIIFVLLITCTIFKLWLIIAFIGLFTVFSNIIFIVIWIHTKQLHRKNINNLKLQIEDLRIQKDILDDMYKNFIIKYNPNDNLDDIVKSLYQIQSMLENQKLSSNDTNIYAVDKLSKLKAEKLLLKNKLYDLGLTIENESNIISKVDNLSEEIENLKDEYEILINTMEYLQKARDNLSSRYMGTIEKSFVKYLNKLEVGELDKYKIDINLDVKIQEYGKLYISDYLSIGTMDLINLCIRIALTDAIFKGKEKPIIMLDDPFANLDEEKLKTAICLLNDISKEYQIIYFTCHSSRQI